MIVIPAAGNGARFKEAGYTDPKPLIPLAGVPLIERVIENVRPLADGPVVVLTKDVVGETRGTAETIAKGVPGDEDDLVVANCDQLLKFPEAGWKRGDGVIFTFPSANPAHSYVNTRSDQRVWSITEKQVVSPDAVSGVYWFKQSGWIVEACREVCSAEGELYLSMALDVMLADGAELYAVDAPTAILGTPEDFQRFEVAMSLCC